ncbi:MAG: hypothetical protein ABSG96_03320 [Terracidiphilus sp.]|jgi:hypothetical protein
MKGFARFILVSQLFGLGLIANAGAPPTAPRGVEVIQAYAGVWEIETEHFDTAHSKAGHEKSKLRNECWKSGGYFACNQYVDGESKALIVFTYNEKEDVYTSYPIPLDGGQAGAGKLHIVGNIWTFPWEETEGDKTTFFRVVNVFVTPDRIEFRQEFSPDKVHWTVTAKGNETRVAGA